MALRIPLMCLHFFYDADKVIVLKMSGDDDKIKIHFTDSADKHLGGYCLLNIELDELYRQPSIGNDIETLDKDERGRLKVLGVDII